MQIEVLEFGHEEQGDSNEVQVFVAQSATRPLARLVRWASASTSRMIPACSGLLHSAAGKPRVRFASALITRASMAKPSPRTNPIIQKQENYLRHGLRSEIQHAATLLSHLCPHSQSACADKRL
jgi:hypothetical protein